MGFDRGERRWQINVSDTQAYRQFGNAVVVPVVEFLADSMKPYLAAAMKHRTPASTEQTSHVQRYRNPELALG